MQLTLLAGACILLLSYGFKSIQETKHSFSFAVIGDFGYGKKYPQIAQQVADLIWSLNPEFIVTLGDNNYPNGHHDDIDENVGRFYSSFIYPYTGKYGEGNPDKVNAFFPALGNHDRQKNDGQAYFDYFSLPNNERYYDIKKEALHLIILDTTRSDLRKQSSEQGKWLKNLLDKSDAKWKLVFMHHPPHSSATRDTLASLRWKFRDWGVTSVIAGHEHFYERIDNNGVPYFINGLGGAGIHDFGEIMDKKGAVSVVRYNEKHGAMLISGDKTHIKFEFLNIDGKLIDSYLIKAE